MKIDGHWKLMRIAAIKERSALSTLAALVAGRQRLREQRNALDQPGFSAPPPAGMSELRAGDLWRAWQRARREELDAELRSLAPSIEAARRAAIRAVGRKRVADALHQRARGAAIALARRRRDGNG